MSETRIGIFGGTFDPVHQTHLDTARCARDRFRLDEVLFVPAPEPPHKRRPVASFAARCAMVERALATEPDCGRLRCSRVEERLPRPSYTIRTMQALMAENEAARLFFIIGMDSLETLPLWHRAAELLALVNLIVVNREDAAPADVHSFILRLWPAYSPAAGENEWINQAGRTLQLLMGFKSPFSSTVIRQALARGESPPGLPGAALDYIREHGLYT